MAAGRRKRKWDVEEPEGGAPAPASDAGGSAAESAPSPAASATSGALTTNSPKPSLAAVVTALVAAEHVPKRPAPLNLRDTDSVIAATAAATSAVVAMLGKSNVQHRPDTIPSGEFSAKIEINDMRNRYLVTNATTQAKIKEETGADVVTRGKFYPDKSRATERDPPLYLFISASTQESVDKAVKAVNEIIEQASITLVEPRIPHEVRRMQHQQMQMQQMHHSRPSGLHGRVYVDIECAPHINLRAKVVGPAGAYMKHIQQETNTRVVLRGRGSGYVDPANPAEADEPLHISISGSNEQDIEDAKKLCADLIETVRKEVERIQQRGRPMHMGMPPHMPPYGPPPHMGGPPMPPHMPPPDMFPPGPPPPGFGPFGPPPPGAPPAFGGPGGFYGYPPYGPPGPPPPPPPGPPPAAPPPPPPPADAPPSPPPPPPESE